MIRTLNSCLIVCFNYSFSGVSVHACKTDLSMNRRGTVI